MGGGVVSHVETFMKCSSRLIFSSRLQSNGNSLVRLLANCVSLCP